MVQKQHSLGTRFGLLGIGLFAILLVALSIWSFIGSQQLRTAVALAQREKGEMLKQLVMLDDQKVSSYIHINTYWTEFFDAAQRRDKEYIRLNVEDSALLVGIRGLHVLDKNDREIYRTKGQPKLRGEQLSAIKERLKSSGVGEPFYFWSGNECVQISFARICRSDDPDHKGEYAGTLVAITNWGRAKEDHLQEITDAIVELHQVGRGRVAHQASEERYSVHLPLLGANGDTVAELDFTFSATDLIESVETGRQTALSLISVFMIGFLILVLLQRTWVFHPLKDLASAISTRDNSKLLKYQPERSEIGQLARAISDSFDQRAALLFEVEVRRQTEEELATAKEEAERANQAKSEFLSHMSHELRTPLNAVIGFAQLIQMRKPDEKSVESADAIMKGGKHLLNLVNEVLDFAKCDAGKLSLSVEPVGVADIVAEVESLVGPTFQQHGVHLAIQPLPPEQFVSADRQRLIQILINLLSNGAKYNRPGGSVELSGQALPDGRFQLRVRDTGIGISDDDQKKLFAPFERLGDQSAHEGTGLGLALSKNLASLMSGELRLAESSPDGSTFVLELNSAERRSATNVNDWAVPDISNPGEVASYKVVYVEDNLPNLELMHSLFESLPEFDLTTASNATEGWQKIGQIHPHLVLLDLNLPDLHGSSVLEKLKNNPETTDIPVVVLSADATPSQVRRLLDMGAKAYLTKPLDFAQLLEQIHSITKEPKRAA